MFCMREIAELRFVAAYFFQIERDGRLHLNSFYGAQPEEIGLKLEPVDMSSNLPFTSCIRDGRLLWTGRIQSFKQNGNSRFRSILAWPINSDFRTIGSFLALAETPVREDAELQECMEAFATLVGAAIATRIGRSAPHQLSRNLESASHNLVEADGHLTERQEVILKMIAEGRTNGDIADILGYSESLIRQETIRIYASLGCSGRTEAGRIYRERMTAPALVESP